MADGIQAKLDQLLAQNEKLVLQNADLQDKLSEDLKSSVTPALATHGVRPKLAPFWIERPAAWFAHIESQFALCLITADETKYNYVVSQIDSRLSYEVEDLVINPPGKDRYSWIKEEMIRRFSTSESQKVRQLLSGEELGDRKPTQFLRHLRSLAGKTFSDDKIMRELWLQRLPRNAQAILTAQADLSLDKVAELADKILEVNPVSVCTVSTEPFSLVPIPSVSPDLAEITIQLQKLTKQVAALSAQRPQQQSRSRSRRPSKDPTLCWYHSTYATKAAKCVQPCSWSGNQPNSQ